MWPSRIALIERQGMVTDEQVRRLRKLSNTEKNQEIAASKAGMDPTTARRYLGLKRLPSELKKERPWRTRERGSVWRGAGRRSAADPRESRTGGQGAVRVAAAGIPGAVQRRADPDAATADQAMAGDGGTGAGSVLRPETHAGAAVRVGLHAHDRAGDHARGADVRAPGGPLRADVLERGDGHDVLFGEPGEPQRRMVERGVGMGSGAGRAPHRQTVERGEPQ